MNFSRPFLPPRRPVFGVPQCRRKVKTRDVTQIRGTLFEHFKLERELLMGIFAKGWDLPSPIQELSIPIILSGRNVLAKAKNGTGKTGAYAIPLLQLVKLNKPKMQAIVIVPSREIALQVYATLVSLAKYTRLHIRVATGGNPLRDDIYMLKSPTHILVATPGRFQSIIEQRPNKVSECSMVVIDEADRMCSDFEVIIDYIIGKLPSKKQFILFSATYPIAIRTFVERNIKDPAEIDAMNNELTLVGVTQYYVVITESVKVQCLSYIMANVRINQCLIFVNSSNRAELLATKLNELGYCCMFAHAQLMNHERDQIFHNFRKGIVRNLVCSDLYSRGIDIKAVNVVVNFDFPATAVRYLHRIGRSGRFGSYGLAISFITANDIRSMEKIERDLKTIIRPMPREINPTLYADFNLRTDLEP